MMTFIMIVMSAVSLAQATFQERCRKIESPDVNRWLEQERLSQWKSIGNKQPVRSRSWLPDVHIGSESTLDDGDQSRVSDGTQNNGLRFSTLREGDRRSRYTLNLRWRLSTHNDASEALAWQRYQAKRQEALSNSLRRLVAVYLRWFSAIKKQCEIDVNVPVSLEVLALEIELNHLSYGRFQKWTKEKR